MVGSLYPSAYFSFHIKYQAEMLTNFMGYRLYKTLVRLIMTYVSETWTPRNAIGSELDEQTPIDSKVSKNPLSKTRSQDEYKRDLL